MNGEAGKTQKLDRRATWTVLGACTLLSAVLHIYFLATPGFEDDLRWQINWGKRVSKEGLWKLYEGDYAARQGKFNHHDIVDYPPVVPLIIGGTVKFAKAIRQTSQLRLMIKLIVTIFEIALIAILAWLVLTHSTAPRWRQLFMAGLILVSPGMALATTGWGQIDSLLCLLIVLALYFGWKDQFWLSTPLILLTVLTKPQGVLALGCYFLMLLWRRKYNAFWIQGAVGFLVLVSLIVAFRVSSHSDFLAIYLGAVGAFPATSWTAFNLWELIFGDESMHVLGSATVAGFSYHSLGLALFLFTALCAGLSFWRSRQTLENLMLFTGWIYLAFFLFPTEIHGRFLYYGVVLLALPALRSNMLLGAYVALSVILYFNVNYSMERFAPGMYAEFVMPESMSNGHRVLSFIALVAGALFFVEILRALIAPRLGEVAQADSPALDKFLDGSRP
jgi:Gpi18-like mannosyltransferase